MTDETKIARPRGTRTSCRPSSRSGGTFCERPNACVTSTAIGQSRPRSSRRRRSSSGPPARARTSSRRRCTRSRIGVAARSRFAPRRRHRSAARTSRTACTVPASRPSSTRSGRSTATPPAAPLPRVLQLSVEAIGSDDPALDAEVIQLYDTLLDRGVPDTSSSSTPSGAGTCRPAYLEKLGHGSRRTPSASTQRRARRPANPLRVFDNLDEKPAAIQQVLGEAL